MDTLAILRAVIVITLAVDSLDLQARPLDLPLSAQARRAELERVIDAWRNRPRDAYAPPVNNRGYAVLRVGMSGDPGCTHFSVQDAINDAPDFARIKISIPYGENRVGQNLVIENRFLTLSGGYEDCSDDIPDVSGTVLDGGGYESAAVLTIRNTSGSFLPAVYLFNLVIRNGEGNGSPAWGGGLHITGRVKVVMHNTLVVGNEAAYGGGISISTHDGSQPYADAGIWLYDDSQVVLNEAFLNPTGGLGGGINCYRSHINLGAGTEIRQNAALPDPQWLGGHGGGLRLDACTLDFVDDCGERGPLDGISLNYAGASGGGIWAHQSVLDLDFAQVASNESGTADANAFPGTSGGGGIWMHASDLSGDQISIVDNTALRGPGGGLLARWDSEVGIRSSIVSSGCVFRSSRISGNRAELFGGGGMALFGAGNDPTSHPTLAVVGKIEMYGNQAPYGSAVLLGEQGTELILDGAVLARNRGSNVIKVWSDAHLTQQQVSFFDNLTAADQSVLSLESGVSASLRNSVLAEPIGSTLEAEPGASLQVTCSIATETSSLPADADVQFHPWVTSNILFLAPARVTEDRLDFLQPHPAGTMLDRCAELQSEHDSYDLRRLIRGQDAPAIPDAAGRFDVGAYESDVLFYDSFELWGL